LPCRFPRAAGAPGSREMPRVSAAPCAPTPVKCGGCACTFRGHSRGELPWGFSGEARKGVWGEPRNRAVVLRGRGGSRVPPSGFDFAFPLLPVYSCSTAGVFPTSLSLLCEGVRSGTRRRHGASASAQAGGVPRRSRGTQRPHQRAGRCAVRVRPLAGQCGARAGPAPARAGKGGGAGFPRAAVKGKGQRPEGDHFRLLANSFPHGSGRERIRFSAACAVRCAALPGRTAPRGHRDGFPWAAGSFRSVSSNYYVRL
jgi:hypothetical protein